VSWCSRLVQRVLHWRSSLDTQCCSAATRSKYIIWFYESPKNWGYYEHAQTVCTRPLLLGGGEEWRGLGTRLKRGRHTKFWVRPGKLGLLFRIGHFVCKSIQTFIFIFSTRVHQIASNKRFKIKISQGSMPLDPPTLPHALHTNTYLPPNNDTISFCPPWAKSWKKPCKWKENGEWIVGNCIPSAN